MSFELQRICVDLNISDKMRKFKDIKLLHLLDHCKIDHGQHLGIVYRTVMIEMTEIPLSEIRVVRNRMRSTGWDGRSVEATDLYWKDYRRATNFKKERLPAYQEAIEIYRNIGGNAEFVISDTAPCYNAGGVHDAEGRMGFYVKEGADGMTPDYGLFWDILGRIDRKEIE